MNQHTFIGKSIKFFDVIQELVLPKPPIRLMMNHPEAFVFRTSLQDEDSADFILYLGRMKNQSTVHPMKREKELLVVSLRDGIPYDFIKELGRWSVVPDVKDHIILWTPHVSDGLPENGGNNFLLVVQRTTWWGWHKETVYESESIAISPDDSEE